MKKWSPWEYDNWTISFGQSMWQSVTTRFDRVDPSRWSRSMREQVRNAKSLAYEAIPHLARGEVRKTMVRIILDHQHSRGLHWSRFIRYYQRAAQRCVRHRRTGRLCCLAEASNDAVNVGGLSRGIRRGIPFPRLLGRYAENRRECGLIRYQNR